MKKDEQPDFLEFESALNSKALSNTDTKNNSWLAGEERKGFVAKGGRRPINECRPFPWGVPPGRQTWKTNPNYIHTDECLRNKNMSFFLLLQKFLRK